MVFAAIGQQVAHELVRAASAGGEGMSPFMQLVLALALLITAAKFAGIASVKLGQPAVLGELLAGIVLGPSLLNLLGWSFFTDEHLSDGVLHIAELGVLFLMFVAGLEVKLDDLLSTGKAAVLAGLSGVLVPLLGGAVLAWMWFSDYSTEQNIFLGILLTATSVSISAQTLLELGRLRSRVGLTLLGAAVIDDIVVIVILSTYIALVAAGGGGVASIVGIIVAMIGYFVVASLIGAKVLPWLTRKAVHWPISQSLLSTSLVLVLLAAWSAEVLGGVAGITGAFLVGIFLGRTPYHNRIEHEVQTITYSFFVPVFFASIGLQADLRLLDSSLLGFALVFCVVAVLTKLIGCGLGAKVAGMTNRESWQVGMGMVSRGEVGLIVATVGINAGVIGEEIFAVTVLMVLVTTIVTPFLLRIAFSRESIEEVETATHSSVVVEAD